jgi:hypothetical protein
MQTTANCPTTASTAVTHVADRATAEAPRAGYAQRTHEVSSGPTTGAGHRQVRATACGTCQIRQCPRIANCVTLIEQRRSLNSPIRSRSSLLART